MRLEQVEVRFKAPLSFSSEEAVLTLVLAVFSALNLILRMLCSFV